jgi:hypothetical protein
MPSFLQITKTTHLPEQTVNVYAQDGKTIIETFGVIFNSLKRAEIDDILERFRDPDDNYGETEGLDAVVAKYTSGWTDLPTKLTDIQDVEVRNYVKEITNINDVNAPFTEAHLVKILNRTMNANQSDAVWATFLRLTGLQFEAHTSSNKPKPKRNR